MVSFIFDDPFPVQGVFNKIRNSVIERFTEIFPTGTVNNGIISHYLSHLVFKIVDGSYNMYTFEYIVYGKIYRVSILDRDLRGWRIIELNQHKCNEYLDKQSKVQEATKKGIMGTYRNRNKFNMQNSLLNERMNRQGIQNTSNARSFTPPTLNNSIAIGARVSDYDHAMRLGAVNGFDTNVPPPSFKEEEKKKEIELELKHLKLKKIEL